MGIKDKGALLNWGLVVAIAVSGLAAAAMVIVSTSATKAISAQAERSLHIADMQEAVQVEIETAAQFAAQLPGMTMNPDNAMGDGNMGDGNMGDGDIHLDNSDPTDLSDHPGVREASAAFRDAADAALSMAPTPEEARQVRSALAAHDKYIDSLARLNEAAHGGGDAMSVYHVDTQVAEGELLTSVQLLRADTVADLSEAVDRSEWAQRLLGAVLPVAAIAALIAAIWLIRTRRAKQRVSLLEHVIAEKERFIETVSHELRTPLAGIVGFTELLASTDDHLSESEQHEYLSLILSQGNEVSAIVDDLLVAARAEIGELTLVTVPVDLAAQARQVVEALEFNEETPDVPETSVVGLGDPGRVRQIIRNLLTNAIRYGGPNITIDIEADDEIAAIQIIDDGEPIPPDERARIFEPYTSLESKRPVTGSIGLGLTVSQQLAVLMKGDLRYEEREGRSAFILTLPLAKERSRNHRQNDRRDATGGHPTTVLNTTSRRSFEHATNR